MKRYDPLYVQFIYYFNEKRDYFECHEVMEELWLEEGRNPILQGLLQVAVGLYHFQNQNISGSIKLFEGAIQKLEAASDIMMGIQMSLLLVESKQYVDRLYRYADEPFEFDDLTIHIVDPLLEQAVQTLIEQPPHTDDDYEQK